MDKETLSHYGWIVILVLVLSVMIALATPFGGYVRDASMSILESLGTTASLNLDTVLMGYLEGEIDPGEPVPPPTPTPNPTPTPDPDPTPTPTPDPDPTPTPTPDPDPTPTPTPEEPEGTPVAIWDISEVHGTNKVEMRYYPLTDNPGAENQQPGDHTDGKGDGYVNVVYEGGTVYITGEGRMEESICHYFLDIPLCVQSAVDHCEATSGYNCRAEYNTETNNIGYAFGSLKIYIDDETAGEQNGTVYDWEASGFVINLNDRELYKYHPDHIIIGEGITNISNSAFLGMSSIKTVQYPSTLKEIGDRAFGHCYTLSNIDLPEGLTSIGEEAFYFCTNVYSDIILPTTLTSIGNNAFTYCFGTFKGTAGTYAQTWANENGYGFTVI